MTSQNKTMTTFLVVDRHNVITELGKGWLEEAQKGHAETKLAKDKVIGAQLSDFIRDDNTVMYVEASLSLCRVKNEVIYREYRCDSPTHKRFMELELTPFRDKSVKMTHFLLKEEAFERRLDIEDTMDEIPSVQSESLLRCSMCNSIKDRQLGKWIKPEVYLRDENFTSPLKVIHTVCPHCRNTVWKIRH